MHNDLIVFILFIHFSANVSLASEEKDVKMILMIAYLESAEMEHAKTKLTPINVTVNLGSTEQTVK